MTSNRSQLFGLIGNPVAHSLSPFIMNRAFSSMGLDAVYVAFGVRPQMLEMAVGGLYSTGASGLNITYPYKEEILYHVDTVSSNAELVQAINTLVFDDDAIHGHNTDAPGTATALDLFADVSAEGRRVFIYGCGGSGRAAACGLLEEGAKSVTFCARSPESAEMAVERFEYAFPEQTIDWVPFATREQRPRREELFRNADIIINATPVGMTGVSDGNVIEDPAWILRSQCFFDFVYHPRQTAFLATARARGATTLGGIALLVSQAMESFGLWTDQTFDVKEMAAALELFSNDGSRREGVN